MYLQLDCWWYLTCLSSRSLAFHLVGFVLHRFSVSEVTPSFQRAKVCVWCVPNSLYGRLFLGTSCQHHLFRRCGWNFLLASIICCTLISDRCCEEHMCASKCVWDRPAATQIKVIILKICSSADSVHTKLSPQRVCVCVFLCCAVLCQKASSKSWHFHHRTWHES